jgi:hypothetical protein
VEYKITKVYVVEAEDRHEAKRRIAADGADHLQVISIQEVKAPGEWPTLGGLEQPALVDGIS